MKLLLARLQGGLVVKRERLGGKKPTLKDCEELTRIWDALSDNGRKILLAFAVMATKEEGRPEGAGSLIRTGKR